MSDAARNIALRLDELSRDIIRAWLLRGLEKGSLPPEGELSARLGSAGKAFRESVVKQAEAIALEGLLTPSQAKKWRTTSGRSAGLRKGRYGPLPSTADKPPRTTDDCEWAVRSMAGALNRNGATSSLLMKIVAGANPTLAQSDEQLALALRLDELARLVSRDYLLRGLQGLPPTDLRDGPPPPQLAERLSRSGDLLLASVVAHAELLVTEAVLDPEQAEKARHLLWSRLGLLALLDPELDARLGLSRNQVDDVFYRMVQRSKVVHEVAGMKAAAAWGVPRAQHTVAGGEPDRLQAEADAIVLDVLTPRQAQRLKQILGDRAPAPPRPNPKPKKEGRSS